MSFVGLELWLQVGRVLGLWNHGLRGASFFGGGGGV